MSATGIAAASPPKLGQSASPIATNRSTSTVNGNGTCKAYAFERQHQSYSNSLNSYTTPGDGGPHHPRTPTIFSGGAGTDAHPRSLTRQQQHLSNTPGSGAGKFPATPSYSQPIGSRAFTTDSAKKRQCNCKKSNCLKLYCECFAAGVYCNEKLCNCANCYNNEKYESVRKEAIQATLERNPAAFRPKIASSESCKCQECKNFEGNADRAHALEVADSGGKSANPSPSPFKRPRTSGSFAASPAASVSGPPAHLHRLGVGVIVGSAPGGVSERLSVGSMPAYTTTSGGLATIPVLFQPRNRAPLISFVFDPASHRAAAGHRLKAKSVVAESSLLKKEMSPLSGVVRESTLQNLCEVLLHSAKLEFQHAQELEQLEKSQRSGEVTSSKDLSRNDEDMAYSRWTKEPDSAYSTENATKRAAKASADMDILMCNEEEVEDDTLPIQSDTGLMLSGQSLALCDTIQGNANSTAASGKLLLHSEQERAVLQEFGACLRRLGEAVCSGPSSSTGQSNSMEAYALPFPKIVSDSP